MNRAEHSRWVKALSAVIDEPTGRKCPASKKVLCGCELLEWYSELESFFYQFYFRLRRF